MAKIQKLLCSVTVMLTIVFLFTSCLVSTDDTDLPWANAPGITDKLDYTNGKTVKVALSLTGTEDPLLALNYRLGGDTGPYYFDYIVLCSAKMVADTSGSVINFKLDLSDVQSILTGNKTLLAPLQVKGIKIVLQIINGNSGYSFANLPYDLRLAFAKTCRDVLVQYNLDGFEFNDINGGLGAYPSLTETEYYDPAFDQYPDYAPANIGDRINVTGVNIPADYKDPTNGDIRPLNNDQKVEYFWLMGGYNYGSFLAYFRPLDAWQNESGLDAAVIGTKEDKPIWVRETGFGEGNNNLDTILDADTYGYFHSRNSYISDWIEDKDRPDLVFTAVADMATVFMNPGTAPNFGWQNGMSIMTFATHEKYSPGIIDLNTVSDADIAAFTTRFANGNMDNLNDFISHGIPYALLYYANVGAEDAARLSISSRVIYGGREEDGYNLTALLNNGPEVVFTDR